MRLDEICHLSTTVLFTPSVKSRALKGRKRLHDFDDEIIDTEVYDLP